jgi:hypothetical protein
MSGRAHYVARTYATLDLVEKIGFLQRMAGRKLSFSFYNNGYSVHGPLVINCFSTNYNTKDRLAAAVPFCAF